MADRENLIVDGFFFGSFDDAQKAIKEQKNAEYIEERINSMTPSQMVGVYDKMLDQKVFETPVGWEYLKYLRQRIIEAGVDKNSLRPIPLFITFTSRNDDNDYSHIAKMYVRNRKKKARDDAEKLKLSIGINLLLVLLVVLMFIITLNSSNPNIINYKKAITDQYSSWEQELLEREAALREKEKAIENING